MQTYMPGTARMPRQHPLSAGYHRAFSADFISAYVRQGGLRHHHSNADTAAQAAHITVTPY